MNNLQLLFMSGAASAEGGSVLDTIISFAPIVIVIIVFYFMLIRPQQKKDKADRAMRENLDIGDEVVTIGGIVGIVCKVSDNYVVIETGSDRCKIRFTKNAIAENITAKQNEMA